MDFTQNDWKFVVDSYLRLTVGEKPRPLRSLGTFVQYVLNGWLYFHSYQEQRKPSVKDLSGVDLILRQVMNRSLGINELDFLLQSMFNRGQKSENNYDLTGETTGCFILKINQSAAQSTLQINLTF